MNRRCFRSGPAWRAVLALVMTITGLAGCGIPADEHPETLPGGVVSPAVPSPVTSEQPVTQARTVAIYFVSGGRATPVERTTAEPDVTVVVALLLAGPTSAEVAAGFRTAVAPGTRLRSASVQGGTVSLDLTNAFVEVGGQEQILAVAQLVLTATVVPGVERVSIALDGQVVEVPRADGTLAAGPLSAEDYRGLLNEPPA